jgi:hypothetical protein
MKRIAFVAAFLAVGLAFLLAVISPAAIACTLGGVTGSIAEDHDVFIGQTMDNPWWHTRHTLWVVQPKHGYKYLGTKAYIWGFWTGINEKGFSWAGSYIAVNDKGDPSGINRFDIGPMLLEKCVTVYDAIEIIKKSKRSDDFPTRNAIMADAQGNLALVEISYTKVNVETLTRDGFVVRTNTFTSKKMWDVNQDPNTTYFATSERLARGYEWFDKWFSQKHHKKIGVDDFFSPLDGYWSYVYAPLQSTPDWGPGTVGVMQPKKLTYWFNYGWPGGNLPPKNLETHQINQNMTWGAFLPFHLPEMPPGQYTTELGQLTPLAIQYLYSHFNSKPQRTPAWVNYQSADPLAPYYKPAEDIASPDGYAPKDNPFGPGGFVGTWNETDGFKPCTACPTP